MARNIELPEKRISYSEIVTWNQCPLKHYCKYILKEKGGQTEHTLFGHAIHEAIESLLSGGENTFLKDFEETSLKSIQNGDRLNLLLLEKMKLRNDVPDIVYRKIKNDFSDYDIFSLEEPLIMDIEGSERKFVGFIDCVLFNKETGRYLIIDWKTTEKGWNPFKKNGFFQSKKTDKITTMQLALYKHYFSLKNSVPLKNIDCRFVLLKWGSKKEEKVVEFVEVKANATKIKNSLLLLKKCLTSVESGVRIANRSNCNFCDFADKESGICLKKHLSSLKTQNT